MHIIKDNLFDIPPLFQLIQEESRTDWKEMYKVFNMGHRMEVYVPAVIADDIIKIANSFNIKAQKIGYCKAAASKKLTISGSFGTFDY